MSRTVRKRKRKANLTPYTKPGKEGKFLTDDKYMRNKRSEQLTVKNANRSKKKGVRQESKGYIKKVQLNKAYGEVQEEDPYKQNDLINKFIYFEESWNQ